MVLYALKGGNSLEFRGHSAVDVLTGVNAIRDEKRQLTDSERAGNNTMVSANPCRGTLWLKQVSGHAADGRAGKLETASWLMDLSGRKVLTLHQGANDVSRVAPGVYFVRSEPSAVRRQPLVVTKVVLTR
jgi:hypothetical protein